MSNENKIEISKFKVFQDLAYCTAAVIVLNGVTQFIIFPNLNSQLGTGAYGDILYLLSFVSIIGTGFGTALSNIRLVYFKRGATNGDFLVTAFGFCLIGIGIGLVAFYFYAKTLAGSTVFVLLIVATILRYYYSVAFRININYHLFFIYYTCTAVFYYIGLLVLPYTGNWMFIFIFGELAALCFGIIFGKALRYNLKFSANCLTVFKDSSFLSISYLVSNLVLSVDRIILKNIVHNEAVSWYYVASLLGKLSAMLMGPLSNVLLTYISKYKLAFNQKSFLVISLLILLISGGTVVGCIVFTPIFVKIFYPNFVSHVSSLIAIGSFAQIMYFAANFLLVVILTFSKSKWQLVIQLIYSVVFIATTSLYARKYGLDGFAKSAAVINFFYFVSIVIFGFSSLNNKDEI